MDLFSKLKTKVSSISQSIKSAFGSRKLAFDNMLFRVHAGQSGAGDIIGSLIAIVVGVSLYPVVADVIADVNATGVQATLLNLVPTLYVIGVIVGAIAWMGLSRMGK